MKNIYFIVISILFLFLFACENNSTETYKQGLVLDFGNPALDGCGWVIEVDKTIYSPVTLETEFCKDSLAVSLIYQELEETAQCAWRVTNYHKITIANIKITNH